jgi:IMP dehydrogenase
MQFLYKEDEHKELTYEEVFIIPQYSEAESRMDVDLTPVDNISTTLPIVVANMTAVAGRRMAETIARRGGLVILPQDIPLEKIRETIEYIKSRHTIFETPITLTPTDTIQTALGLIYKRSHGAIVIIDHQEKPIGIFVEKDAGQEDLFTKLKDVMSKNIISITDKTTPKHAFAKLQKSHVSVIPIVKKSGQLVGVITQKSAIRSTIYKPATDKKKRLLAAVAIGINGDITKRIKTLLGMGIDVLVIDTAHGYQKKMIEAIKTTRKIAGKKFSIVAGNVASDKATEELIKAGANIIKVGIGPGAMCTTRMMTGVGRPQFSCVANCARVARNMNANVWADGGIRYPRDVALAIAAGASSAVIGTWFAGTYESAADIQKDERGQLYKENFGMASRRAVNHRNRGEDSFTRVRKEYFEEGISHSRMYLKKESSSVEDIVDSITAGLRSACTYIGAKNLNDLHKKAIIGVQTNSGFKECKATNKTWY